MITLENFAQNVLTASGALGKVQDSLTRHLEEALSHVLAAADHLELTESGMVDLNSARETVLRMVVGAEDPEEAIKRAFASIEKDLALTPSKDTSALRDAAEGLRSRVSEKIGIINATALNLSDWSEQVKSEAAAA